MSLGRSVNGEYIWKQTIHEIDVRKLFKHRSCRKWFFWQGNALKLKTNWKPCFFLIPDLCLDLLLLAWGTSKRARQFGFGWWWSPFKPNKTGVNIKVFYKLSWKYPLDLMSIYRRPQRIPVKILTRWLFHNFLLFKKLISSVCQRNWELSDITSNQT